MDYQFNILCFIRFFSAFTAVLVAILLLKRIKLHGAMFLMLFELAAAIWSFGDAFEAASLTPELKMHWSAISYLGVSTSAVFFLLFAIQYTQHSHKINKWLLLGLFIIPLFTILVALSNPWHHLLWTKIDIIPGTHDGVYYYGPYFWVHLIYEYSILTTGFLILFIYAFRVFSLYSTQLWLLLVGLLFPFVSSFLYVFKLFTFQGIDPTPISFVVTGLVIIVSLYRYRFLTLMPFARKQAINNLRDVMIIIDANEIVVDFNPVLLPLIELPPKKIFGEHVNIILNSFNTSINQFAANSHISIEANLVLGNQEKFFEINCHPVVDVLNKEIGKILVMSEVTAKKKMFDALVESNKRIQEELLEKEKLIADLDAYARSVAHDLKSPAALIYSFSELFNARISSMQGEKAIEISQQMSILSKKMMGIIENLLLLSRLRKEDIAVIPVDISHPVIAAIDRLSQEIINSGAIIHRPSFWPIVMGNSIWIEEVWVNLLSNAIKYGGAPPEIKLSYEEYLPGIFRFSVSDNGEGLPKESLAKLFTDFERLQKQHIPGYGFGLSMVKRIITKMDGEVEAVSKNIKGQGCTFSFTLHAANGN